MLFNSFGYLLFLPVVYIVFFLTGERTRWGVLLVASLLFYAAFKLPHLIVVLAIVATVTYGFGIWIEHCGAERGKRALLWAGILANVIVLIAMKYVPFLVQAIHDLGTVFSAGFQIQPIKTIAAIGVSYYIFQAISYLFDVYLEVEPAEHHYGRFVLFLAFFPKMLQGPIERVGDLAPQFEIIPDCELSKFKSGLMLIVVGLFKKIVIADRLSMFCDPVFSNVQGFSGVNLIGAVYVYAFCLYFDFSGYTDMAIGSARLFNIDLTQNFNNPYIATSVADFWRRWHISFSRWILDYIFKPLQMQWRNWKSSGTAVALLITFIISGLWHGASWGFVIWGALHGLYMAISIYSKSYRKKLHNFCGLEGKPLLKWMQIAITFNLICFAWLFFRANSVSDAWYIIVHSFQETSGTSSLIYAVDAASDSGSLWQEIFILMISIFFIAIYSFGDRDKVLKCFSGLPFWMRFTSYYFVVMYLLLFGYFTKQGFAYVRF